MIVRPTQLISVLFRNKMTLITKKPLDLVQKCSLLTQKNVYYKAKPEKADPKAKGGKQQPAQPVQEVSDEIDGFTYLQPRSPSLSPKESKAMNENFDDISAQDKQILDDLAEEIIRLKSSTFYKLVQQGGLGTEDALFVSQRQLQDTQIKQSVAELRKEI